MGVDLQFEAPGGGFVSSPAPRPAAGVVVASPEELQKKNEADLAASTAKANTEANPPGIIESVIGRVKSGVVGGMASEVEPIIRVADAPLVSAGADHPLVKTFLDPVEQYKKEKQEQYSSETIAGSIGLQMAEGLGHMAVTLPIDAAIGSIIIGGLVAAGAPITVPAAGVALAGIHGCQETGAVGCGHGISYMVNGNIKGW